MKYQMINEQKVSLLGFGCMRLPTNSDDSIDEKAAFELWDYAYQNGVNYFDTAYVYHEGASEVVLGKWLQSIDRESVYLASKLPLWDITDINTVEEIFVRQLEKLQTSYIDFYLLHAIRKSNWQTVLDLKVLSLLEKYKAQGKIRNIGFSFHDSFAFFEEVIRAYPWDFCQIQLNYMDVNYQAGSKGAALAHELGIPQVIMEPLKGGLLAVLPEKEKALLDSQHSAATMAFRWLADYPGIAVILSGMHRKSDVVENIATINDLPACNAREKENIAKVAASLNANILVDCTACGYCVPCASNVDIPGCFKYLNVGNRYNNFKVARTNYELNVADKRASNCTQCLACLDKCPQQIAIVAMLKLVVEKLEGSTKG